MIQYGFAWLIFVVQLAKLVSQYCAGASGVQYSCLSNEFLAVSTIVLGTCSPGAAGLSQPTGLLAIDVDAIVCCSASISSSVIAFLLPFFTICWPDIFRVVKMSIKSHKGFYDNSSCCQFVVFDSAPVLLEQDEVSGSLTYESPPSTYCDQPRPK